MSSRFKSLVLIFVMALAPMVPFASAHPTIGLSTDVSHIILSPGESANLSLTIDNNGSSIESYVIDVSGYNPVWEIIPTDTNVSNVIPTFSATTTIVIRLSTNATPSDSGTLTITVTEPDDNISSHIDVYISAQARYLPGIDVTTAGDNGLVSMAPGDNQNITITTSNLGNVEDTILLSVDQTPDFAGFWANWTSGETNNSTNNSSNNTSGNNTNGNNTNGNNTNGNNTSGNNTSGNNTSGNNTSGNLTGNSTNGTLIMSVPQGWEVRFLDNSMDSMSPFETRTAILRISIPTDANPGYYGFELFSATALGNFSVSTIMIVNVSATHDLSFNHIQGDILLPGMNSTSIIDITSLSSSVGNWTWQIDTKSGNCSAQLNNLQTQILEDSNYQLQIIINAHEDMHVGEICEFHLSGSLDMDTSIVEEYNFSITIGEMWGFSMVIPNSIKLDVDTAETFNVVIKNEGTELDTLSLIGIDQPGVTFTNPDPVSLDRGESVYVVMEVTVDNYLVGDIQLDFTLSSTKSGVDSINASGIFEIKEYASLSVTGPLENRISLIPGSNSSVSLNVSNSGTKDLDISASVSGLPNGVTITQGLGALTVDAGDYNIVEVTISASSTVSADSYPITFNFDSSWVSSDLTLDLQISDRIEVVLGAVENSIIASPIDYSNLSVMITNLGTVQETFVVEIDNELASEWFSISVDALSLTLESGESGSITLSVREISTGGPQSGIPVGINVTSSSNSLIKDSTQVLLIPQIANGTITVYDDDHTAKPGENISGRIVIRNTGSSVDIMTVTVVEIDCDIEIESVTLGPGVSSSQIPYKCVIQNDANAGAKVMTFRVTSTARSDLVITSQEVYTVVTVYENSAIEITFNETKYKFDSDIEDMTIPFTVCNQANTPISGKLDTTGTNKELLSPSMYVIGESGVNKSYTLQSKGAIGDCDYFKLSLSSLRTESFRASITIKAESMVGSQSISDESESLTFEVDGPSVPPDGMDLGFMKLSNQNSIVLLSAGWAISLLMFAYIRLFRKAPEIEEEEVEEEEIPLGPNEVRIDEYNKVTCTSCDARLGVPEDSEPPFRFTCPKCQVRIRVVN